MRHLIVVFMIDMSFNYDRNLFNGLEITTGKVDHDEPLKNKASYGFLQFFFMQV